MLPVVVYLTKGKLGLAVFPSGFRRKEFRGKLAIAITANFINRNTTAEAKVEEISGVAFIFNQRFFQELRSDTGNRKIKYLTYMLKLNNFRTSNRANNSK